MVEELEEVGCGGWGGGGGGGLGWVLGGVLLLITVERNALCPTELPVLCPEYRVQVRKE